MTPRTIPVDVFDLIVFGATGDLAQRKLLPALFHRDVQGQIPLEARIIGSSRRAMTREAFRAFALAAIEAYVIAANALAQALASIAKVLDVKNVVIGGGMTAAWPLMQQAFKTRLDADLIPAFRGHIQVKISSAEDAAGMMGAAMLSTSLLASS